MRFAFFALILLIPSVSNAAIIISEVAWMGSTVSANHEWIELQNTGGSNVDVLGWTLTDGANLSIPLSGSISAGQYVVLERSSDASAIGSAFIIYTGALVNTGTTLKITRTDGGLEDQVAGGTDWSNIGGDNVTKETAQYTSTGWVTGASTPGSTNSGTVKKVVEDDETETETQTKNSTPRSAPAGETVRLLVKGSTLAVAVDAQKIGYVNQGILFTAKPAGVGRTIENSMVYQWNFGDGSIGYGKEVSHGFLYPGTYVVTLYSAYATQKQLTRHEITILPVAMTLTRSRSGDIQVNNDSPYEIDISGYAVEGKKSFVFPNYSVLLPNQTITLPTHKVGGTQAWIKDTLGEIVTAGFSAIINRVESATEEATSEDELIAVPFIAPLTNSVPTPPSVSQFGFATTAPLFSTSTTSTLQAAAITATTTTTGPTIPKTADKTWPYVGLIIIMTLGLIGTAFKVTRNKTQ